MLKIMLTIKSQQMLMLTRREFIGWENLIKTILLIFLLEGMRGRARENMMNVCFKKNTTDILEHIQINELYIYIIYTNS